MGEAMNKPETITAVAPEAEKEEFEIKVGFGTDRGPVRELNEDSFSVFIPFPGSEDTADFRAVLAVADGMGGHKGGNLASHFITDRINDYFIQGKYKTKFEQVDDMIFVMKTAVREINRDLYATSKRDKSLGDIGSTLTLGLVKDSVLYVTHVGDSKCFAVRNGAIEQLSKDHSWVADQVRSGVLTKEEARNHPRQNIITQAIGFDPNIEPQVLAREVKPGDRFILCSDGLSNHVKPEEMLDAVTQNPNPQRACDILIQMAIQRGGDDNITAVLGYIDKPMPKTAQLDNRIQENPEARRFGIRRLSRKIRVILLGAAGFIVLFAAFWSGFWIKGLQQGKHIRTLLAESETYLQGGNLAKGSALLLAVLALDEDNKKAEELDRKYNLNLTKRGGER